MIKLEVRTTEQQMIDGFMAQFKVYLDDTLRGSVDKVKEIISDQIRELILSSPVVEALRGEDLSKELGLTRDIAGSAIDDIINVVQSSIEVIYESISVAGGRIVSGGYIVKVLRSDFTDVLSIQDSSYSTVNGVVIPWLSWLLFAGDATIIYGYRIELDPNSPSTSRTGAIMVKAPGRSWGIPTEYAGTQDDNFLIRALIPLENKIEEIVRSELGV